MAEHLRKNSSIRSLAFIDPFGMALKWSSVKILKGLEIDLWILVPTGIGKNRLLKRNEDISEVWLQKLEVSIGLIRDEIKKHFYKLNSIPTLFGAETKIQKEKNAIDKAGNLYTKKLSEVFKFVSQPLQLKNSTGSIMYHFMMATNNAAAFKIANDIIKKHKN